MLAVARYRSSLATAWGRNQTLGEILADMDNSELTPETLLRFSNRLRILFGTQFSAFYDQDQINTNENRVKLGAGAAAFIGGSSAISAVTGGSGGLVGMGVSALAPLGPIAWIVPVAGAAATVLVNESGRLFTESPELFVCSAFTLFMIKVRALTMHMEPHVAERVYDAATGLVWRRDVQGLDLGSRDLSEDPDYSALPKFLDKIRMRIGENEWTSIGLPLRPGPFFTKDVHVQGMDKMYRTKPDLEDLLDTILKLIPGNAQNGKQKQIFNALKLEDALAPAETYPFIGDIGSNNPLMVFQEHLSGLADVTATGITIHPVPSR